VGGVAVIKVGAATETEMKEKKAASRTRCTRPRRPSKRALSPAGGVALLRASKALDSLKLEATSRGRGDHQARHRRACRWIATNAGHEGSIVVAKVKEGKGDEGFNAATDVYEDLVKAGVIDPAKWSATRSRTPRPSPACC